MDIKKIAKQMVAEGKGILAADESTGTMTKRLQSVNVESTSENRLNFRNTLFSSPNISDYVSGVILFDETIRQKVNGKSISEILNQKNIIPGIKVDKGAKKLALSKDETITEGLDGLRDRLKEYHDLGARFAKWRAVYKISEKDNLPSIESIKANSHALGRYSALVQEAKMVPIVEPELLMDGKHNINVCNDVTSMILEETFYQLANNNVDVEGIVLKLSRIHI